MTKANQIRACKFLARHAELEATGTDYNVWYHVLDGLEATSEDFSVAANIMSRILTYRNHCTNLPSDFDSLSALFIQHNPEYQDWF